MMIQQYTKHLLLSRLFLLAAALLLAACNNQGVAGFSRDGRRVAIVRKSPSGGASVYMTDTNGENLKKVVENYVYPYDVSLNQFGDQILYISSVNPNLQLCTKAFSEVQPNCVVMPTSGGFPISTYLPDGSIFIGYSDPNSGKGVLRLYNSSLIFHDERKDIDQTFLSPNAYKLKRDNSGSFWYFTMQTTEQPVYWVIRQGETLFKYIATRNGLSGPNRITAHLSAPILDVLKQGGGLFQTVSPNGQTLAIRTSVNGAYNLYVVDLSQSEVSLTPLAQNAVFPIQFRFSPDGTEIAYESPVDNHSIWVANADGGNARELVTNASLEGWHGP